MKCFYHNDLDGRCSASLVANYFGNYTPENFFEVDYITPLPVDKVKEKEAVFFVDYSFKENTKNILEELKNKDCKIVWIDHHTSSMELISKYPDLDKIEGIRSDSCSGAALTYMYLYNQFTFCLLPDYVKYVSDYDCWKFEFNPNTTFFKLGIETEEYDALDKIWINLFYEDANNTHVKLNQLIDKGKIIKEYIVKDNLDYLKSWGYETIIHDQNNESLKCLVVNKSSNSWIFGEKYDKYPVVMTWIYNGDRYSYSIYSGNSNVRCDLIAENFGGGGHKGAAGFSSDELIFSKI